MALVDEEGKVIDIWIKPASTNEAKALKERMNFSSYLRKLLEEKELIGDKGVKSSSKEKKKTSS